MEITEFLKRIMHAMAQSFLTPAIIILLLLMLVAFAELGGFIMECILERGKFKSDIPALLESINQKSVEEIEELIKGSGLLKRQRKALLQLWNSNAGTKDAMNTLAVRLLADEEYFFKKSMEACSIVTRIAPMFGLLGTLIPLGPGLLALGKGDVELLSQSMLTAFDTTIAGIISAGICFVIVTIRTRWYGDYLVTLEAIMDGILEKRYPGEAIVSGAVPGEEAGE